MQRNLSLHFLILRPSNVEIIHLYYFCISWFQIEDKHRYNQNYRVSSII